MFVVRFVCFRIYFCSALTFAFNFNVGFCRSQLYLSVVCKICVLLANSLASINTHREPHSLVLAFFFLTFVHSTCFAPFRDVRCAVLLCHSCSIFIRKNRSFIFIFTNFYFYFMFVCKHVFVCVGVNLF